MSEGRRADEELKQDAEKFKARLDQFETTCRHLGEDPAHVALAWLLHQPVVTAPIIGPRTVEQLDGALRALELTLAPDLLKRLDDIFPGPGGRAPEAYAW